MTTHGHRPPWRVFALLAGAVLLLHAVGLQRLQAPAAVPHVQPVQPAAWQVRQLAPVAPSPLPTPVADPSPGGPPIPAPAQAATTPPPDRRQERQPPAVPAPVAASRAEEAPAALAAPAAGPPQVAGPPVAVPRPVRLHYAVAAMLRGAAAQGRAELAWRHDGNAYEARLTTELPPLPARSQHSAGRIAAHGLAPARFAERVRSEEAAHLDTTQGRVVFSANRAPVPLLEGAQDRLSVLLQLQALFAAAPARYPAGSVLAVQTVGTREAAVWQFEVRGTTPLHLPGGSLEAVHLVRPARGDWEPLLELWLAPGQDYAPVRLRLTHPDGDWLDQQWSGTDRP